MSEEHAYIQKHECEKKTPTWEEERGLVKEVEMWRKKFFEQKMDNGFKFIDIKDQNFLSFMFMGLPWDNASPEEMWDHCVICLIQELRNGK